MAVLNLRGKGGDGYMQPGDYLVHVFEVKDNDRTAKPSVDVIYKNETGDIVKETFWTTEAASFRIAKLAIACGAANDPEDPRLDNFNTSDLQGCKVMIRVAKETSEKDGKEYAVVKSFWKAKSTEAEDKDVAKLINTVKGAGRKSNPATDSEPPDVEGDDPF